MDLAELGLTLDATDLLTKLGKVDAALDETAKKAKATQTATGALGTALKSAGQGGATSDQSAKMEKTNFAIEHQAKAYNNLLAVMRKDTEVARSSAAQRILLNSAFASSDASINAVTVAGAKMLAGLRSETAATTSLAVAQTGLTATERELLNAKLRKGMVVKEYQDQVRAEIAASTKQIALSESHVSAYRREIDAIQAKTAALKAERAAQTSQGRDIIASQGRQNASLGLSSKGSALFAPYAQDPNVIKGYDDYLKKKLAGDVQMRQSQEKLGDAIVKDMLRQEKSMQRMIEKRDLELAKARGAANIPISSASSDADIYGAAGVKSPQVRASEIRAVEGAMARLRAEHAAGDVTGKVYSQTMKELGGRMNLLTEGNARARGAVRKTAAAMASLTFEMTGALYGATALGAILAGPALFGVAMLKRVEDAQVGIAGILLSMGQLDGKALSFGKAWEVSGHFVKKVQEDSMRYGIEMGRLMEVNQAAISGGLNALMSLEQIQKVATAGAIAVSSLGLNSQQYVQEVRDLISGGIQPASSTLARSIGVTDALLKQWKSEGPEKVVQELTSRLQGFLVVADEVRTKTLTGSWDILQARLALLLSDSEGFGAIKKAVIDLANYIGNVDVTGKFVFNPEALTLAQSYWEVLKGVAGTLYQLAAAVATISPLIAKTAQFVAMAVIQFRMLFTTVIAGAQQLALLPGLLVPGKFKETTSAISAIGKEYAKEMTGLGTQLGGVAAGFFGLEKSTDEATAALERSKAGAGDWMRVTGQSFDTVWKKISEHYKGTNAYIKTKEKERQEIIEASYKEQLRLAMAHFSTNLKMQINADMILAAQRSTDPGKDMVVAGLIARQKKFVSEFAKGNAEAGAVAGDLTRILAEFDKGAGGGAGANKVSDKGVRAAMLKLEEAGFQASFDLAKDSNDRMRKELEWSHGQSLTSLDDFLAKRQASLLADVISEETAVKRKIEVEQKIAKQKGPEGIDAKTRLIPLETKLTELVRERASIETETAQKRTEAYKAFGVTALGINQQLLEANGDLVGAAVISQALQWGPQIEKALANGQEPLAANMRKLVLIGTVNAGIDAMEVAMKKITAASSIAERGVGRRQAQGVQSSAGAAAELDAIRRKAADDLTAAMVEQIAVMEASGTTTLAQTERIKAMREEIQQLRDASTSFADTIKNNLNTGFADFFLAVSSGTKSLKDAFKDLLISFGQMLQKMIAEKAAAQLMGSLFGDSKKGTTGVGGGVLNTALDWLGGLFASANGNAFSMGAPVQAFAMGGVPSLGSLSGSVMDKPTMFGVGGEAGPEAVVPLKRGKDGKLGIGGSAPSAPPMTFNFSMPGIKDAREAKQASGTVQRSVLAAINQSQRYR